MQIFLGTCLRNKSNDLLSARNKKIHRVAYELINIMYESSEFMNENFKSDCSLL